MVVFAKLPCSAVHYYYNVLQVLQTCTFYDADNGNEIRAKVNTFSKPHDISMNKAKTQKDLTEFFVHDEHKLYGHMWKIFVNM